MAGVIAMASLIEDFESQPSKKRKKDNDAPAVKTITNYFSPVVKPTEKPFSPPRSSNIMDYFKKTSPAVQVASPPPQPQSDTKTPPVEAVSGPGSSTKPVKPSPVTKKPAKRPGRPAKKALLMSPPAADEEGKAEAQGVAPLENHGDVVASASSSKVKEGKASTPSQDQHGSQTGGETMNSQPSLCQDKSDKASGALKKKKRQTPNAGSLPVGTESNPEGVESLPSPNSAMKRKGGRAAKKSATSGKASPEATASLESNDQLPQPPSSTCDAVPEAEAREESELNLSSTVTMSFEDFLKSQSPTAPVRKETETTVQGAKPETDCIELDLVPTGEASDKLSVPASSEAGENPSSTQTSPRTVTVQAEVHPVSPAQHQDLSRLLDPPKVASIFTACQRSRDKKPIAPPPSQQTPANPEPAPVAHRKSNVVMAEEDLELAVLEAGSSSTSGSAAAPKCSQAERKQFMSAFKQASQDALKGKAGKGAAKQKQTQQPTEEEAKNGEEEEGKKGADAEGEAEVAEDGRKLAGKKGSAQKATGKRKRGRPKAAESHGGEHATTPTTPPAPQKAAGKKKHGRPKASPPPASPTREASAPPATTTTTPGPIPPPDAHPTTPKEAEAQPTSDKCTSTSTPEATGTRRRSTRKQSTPVSSQPEPKSTEKDEENSRTPMSAPGPVSTPKSREPKNSVYRSLMVSPPDSKGSPIRMKFTRVFPSPGQMSEFEILSPLAKKDPKKKKQKQQLKAQRLVQKAKALQQNRQAAAANAKANAAPEETASLRRSSRRQHTAKKNYCEPEDAIIYVDNDEDDPKTKGKDTKAKNQKQARSLNEVLGKNSTATKATKTPAVPGTKVAPMFLGKKPQKPSAVVSIFDDSSRDASETSQDDEQFRARREFLKSGLPESFKKQIARTAAHREAYTTSSSCFQSVVHVLQTPDACPMWSLPWPVCARLSCLREEWPLEARLAPPLSGPVGLGVLPANRCRREQSVSGWREDLPEAVRHWLLEEIRAANPAFPAQSTFSQLLRRRAEHLPKTPAPDAKGGSHKPAVESSEPQPVGSKRKREEEEGRSEEGASRQAVAKRQRPSRRQAEEVLIIPDDPPETPRRGRGSRARTRQGQKEEAEEAKVEGSTQKDVIAPDSPATSEQTRKQEMSKEDVMWTEKYQPQHSSEVIGNLNSVRRLHSWLREWKLRADREERKKQQEKKQEGDANDSWASESADGVDEELLCNTLLITGPTGVGKTAAVYACAQELGFKVFEVNCSSQRSGRQILSQLKEATQSHQVDIQGVNAHKPSFFNSYSTSSKPGSSPRKVNSPRRVVSSPHKSQSPRRGASKRGSLTPTSLANFFKTAAKPPAKETQEASTKKPQTASASPRKKANSKESSSKVESAARLTSPPPSPLTTPSSVCKAAGDEQAKRTATSLILFEEVDVIFDDDSGFLAAIKTFMSTTKRPVILTTCDPTFRTSFDGYFDEIHFETPSVDCVSSYLRLLCLAENVRVCGEEVASLLRCTGGDVRQSLLQLQCWLRSGAGATHTGPVSQSVLANGGQEAAGQSGKAEAEPELPPSEANISASLLGLLNVHPHSSLPHFLKDECTRPICWELLAEAGKRGLTPLYSNMEFLLPLPTRLLPPSAPSLHPTRSEPNQPPTPDLDPASVPTTLPLQPAPVPTPYTLGLGESEEEASPVKVSSRMRQKKQKFLHANSANPLQSDSDSDDGFLSLRRTRTPPVQGEPSGEGTQPPAPPQGAPRRRRRPGLTEAERKRSGPVSLGLSSMANYLDQLSSLDCHLPCPSGASAGLRPMPTHRRGPGAEIRCGLTDEPRLEEPSGRAAAGAEPLAREIWAAVESLSFSRCRAGVEQAWAEAEGLEEQEALRGAAQEELTLPVAPHRSAFSLTREDALCPPGVLRRRSELMGSVWSCRASTSSNRATALDVLPALRAICRAEQLKEQGKTKRRFLHYLDGISLGLTKHTLQLLAADFP